MAFEYFIKFPYSEKPDLKTVVSGGDLQKKNPLNLLGKELKVTIPATPTSLEKVVVYHACTQEDLKELFENPQMYGNWTNIIGKKELKPKAK